VFKYRLVGKIKCIFLHSIKSILYSILNKTHGKYWYTGLKAFRGLQRRKYEVDKMDGTDFSLKSLSNRFGRAWVQLQYTRNNNAKKRYKK
jgi:hypothetical protein